MPRATFIAELDIDEDGIYGTDITPDVLSATIFRGRDDFMDAAQAGHLSITLDNHLGKYAPKSPVVITENSVSLTTLIPIRVRTTVPVAIPQFTGFITKIGVDPNPKSQSVVVEATDKMESLGRSIISQRLLKDQPTGLIISRLLDAAEGELSTNPAFDVDESSPPLDYTNFGTAFVTITTSEMMEGRAGLDTINIANASQGWTHPLLNVGTTEAITAAIYVHFRQAGDAGKNGVMLLLDDLTTPGGVGFTLPAVGGSWKRVVASGTFGGANPKLRVTGAQLNSLSALLTGAVHVIPSKNVIPRDIDSGDTNLPYYGLFRKSAMSAIDEVRDNELGGLFYIDGGGTAIYERGSARLSEGSVSLGTVDENFWGIDYNENSDERISKVSFGYTKFDVGPASTYIWQLDLPSSRLIPANGTEIIWADFGFFADDLIRPVANTDYRLNSDPAGTGTDMSGAVQGTFSWTPYGAGVRLKFRNAGTSVYITQLSVRGKPVRLSSDNQVVEYIPPNPPSEPSESEHNYSLNNNKAAITNWAQTIGNYADDQRENLSITLRPRTVSLLEQMLSRRISNRVTLINNDKLYSTGINSDYYIESIRHSIKKSGFLHETTWSLTPV